MVSCCCRILVPVAYDHHWADLRPDNLNSEKEFQARTVFASTQLGRLLLARQLAARCSLAQLPVSVSCLDGGQVRPPYGLLNRLAGGGSGRTAASRINIVQTAVQLAACKELEPGGVSGLYFSGCKGKRSKSSLLILVTTILCILQNFFGSDLYTSIKVDLFTVSSCSKMADNPELADKLWEFREVSVSFLICVHS